MAVVVVKDVELLFAIIAFTRNDQRHTGRAVEGRVEENDRVLTIKLEDDTRHPRQAVSADTPSGSG